MPRRMKHFVVPSSVTRSALQSTRIAQRGESKRLAGACLCLKSNYVGGVTSLPFDGGPSAVKRRMALDIVCHIDRQNMNIISLRFISAVV